MPPSLGLYTATIYVHHTYRQNSSSFSALSLYISHVHALSPPESCNIDRTFHTFYTIFNALGILCACSSDTYCSSHVKLNLSATMGWFVYI